MAYDYSKLKGRIVEKYGTQKAFAELMGWSMRTMSLKINNIRFWSQPEISKAVQLLDIMVTEVPDYFFCKKSSI